MAAARRLAAAPTVGEALPQSMEADGGPARERHGGGRHGGRPQWVPRITESAASDRPRVRAAVHAARGSRCSMQFLDNPSNFLICFEYLAGYSCRKFIALNM